MKVKIEVPDIILCVTLTYVYEDNGSLKMETKSFDTDAVQEFKLKVWKDDERN